MDKKINRTFFCFMLILLSITTNNLLGQSTTNISGQVINKTTGEVVPFALVSIDNEGAITDEEGKFQFPLINFKHNHLTINVSCTGYKSTQLHIDTKAQSFYKIEIEEDLVSLDEVVVKGESKSQEIEKSGFAVASIDMKDLQMKSLEINEILDQTAGLRVRRDGGLGSRTQININA